MEGKHPSFTQTPNMAIGLEGKKAIPLWSALLLLTFANLLPLRGPPPKKMPPSHTPPPHQVSGGVPLTLKSKNGSELRSSFSQETPCPCRFLDPVSPNLPQR